MVPIKNKMVKLIIIMWAMVPILSKFWEDCGGDGSPFCVLFPSLLGIANSIS